MSFLFCCSGESSDSSDDKSQTPQTRTVSSGVNRKDITANNINPKSSTTKSTTSNTSKVPEIVATATKTSKGHQNSNSIHKKDLLDDDNSINETDTITNTGDEANNTPISHPDKQLSSDQQQNIITQVSPSSSNGVISASNKSINSHQNKQNGVEEQDEEDEDDDDDEHDEEIYDEDDDEMEDESVLDLTKLQDGQAFNPETGFLLGKKDKKFGSKKCLILDLDETLVHSSFKYLKTADFTIPVEIDNQVHYVYVIKRPGVDEFLKKVGQWYEVVVFTASVAKYGDPLLNKLDIYNSVHHRLFRDSCYTYQGNFIKNLSQIGRTLSDSIIIDNSPASYIFHPQHSIPISSWFSDTHDNELLDLLPFLEDISKTNVDDVGLVLDISL
ncbi:hypothetical protein DFJ63DRAFT_315346 [Scheffersomyces coipomensis]|uniref:uncharacterized protein n=1 Tax=Scheffersomyces coipomensis TaxID=1788519 RepID=UPI00315D9732